MCKAIGAMKKPSAWSHSELPKDLASFPLETPDRPVRLERRHRAFEKRITKRNRNAAS